MRSTKYVVREADTLWDLAEKYLGDPLKWPVIYDHNNSPEVTALSGSRIVDPDLIFVGQVIYIPNDARTGGSTPATTPSRARPEPSSGRSPARRDVYAPAFKFTLPGDKIRIPLPPTSMAEVKLTGSITLQSNKPIDFLTFTNDSFQVAARNEAAFALQKLVAESKVTFNPSTGQVVYENGITIRSNSRYAPVVRVAPGVSMTTGMPVLKGSIKTPKLRGRINHYVYVTEDFGIEIEITNVRQPRQRPQPVARPEPVRQPAPQTTRQWEVLIGSALIGAAVALVVVTIVEDVVTLGTGLADDPASAAAAAAMLTRGWALVRSARMVPVLVTGAAPAYGR